MDNLRISKTVLPDENFGTPEEWLTSIGVNPQYRQDGSSIAYEVSVDDWIFINRITRGIPVFTRRTWADFVSHKN